VGLTFQRPEWLFVLLLAIPTAVAGMLWFTPMSRVRRGSAVILRVALIALISGMLAGASTVRRTERLAVMAVVDVSGSVRIFGDLGTDPKTGMPVEALKAAHEFIAAAAGQRGADDLLGIVAFDGRAIAIATPSRGPVADRSLDTRMVEGTDIAAALRYAAALLPPAAAGRIVLFTDGNQTAGDALAAARALSARAGSHVPIDVVPITLVAASEVMVEGVDTPPRAAAESTITVRVTLNSTGPATGVLSLTREGEVLDINGGEPGFGRRVELKGGRHVELITVPLPPGRVHRFAAVFEPDRDAEGRAIGDTRPENNRAEAFTATPGKGSVLLVDGVGGAASDSPARTLVQALTQSGIETTLAPAEGLPTNLLAMEQYDLVILDNVPAEAVPPAVQEVLAAYVRDLGGGLVMVGGPDSFGAGGWKGSAIEPILPVKLDLPEKLVQPAAAVVFVIDNSGSMGRQVFASIRTQQEIANQSTALAVHTLDKTDLVGVVVFNSTTTVLVPLAPNSDPDRTSEEVMSIAPGGGTIMGPALEEARQQLRDVKASVKHVIVLSDGESMGKSSLPGLAEKMKKEDGISVSTIGIGDQMDPETMSRMAQVGGGQFYPVANASLLPKIFLKAIRVVRTPLIREGRFEPRILPVASPLTAGIAGPPPALTGFILTQRRPEPTITYAMAAPTGEPLLAHWTVDLGQVAAFTSDAHHWASDWVSGPGIGRCGHRSRGRWRGRGSRGGRS
jgi:uncharacterized membrane protein